MSRSLFPLACVIVLRALPAFAEDPAPADRPVPAVGDIFEYAKSFITVKCARWEVKATGKDGYTLLQCGENLAYIDAATDTVARIMAGDKRLIEFKPRSPTLSFPLQLGKKWSGQYDGYRDDTGASWKSTVACEVTSFEAIKVAAGEFQAYRIECADTWESFPFHGTSPSTVWYAPKPGTVVKAVNPAQSAFDYELVAYRPK
ncbi:MAG TPA: hypothetical protein VEI03_03610 [Stellaceae bacterium]|nr:hypothetical protein [Stellaceae bacterium]